MPKRQKKLKLKVFFSQNCICETFSRSKIYMPNAIPTPTQIQKIGAVIIPKPNFFLKLVTCLTRGKKGENTTFKLEFLICY